MKLTKKIEIMPYTRRDGDNIRWIKDEKGNAICQTFKPHAEAKARRIVLCWNSHDDLLEACRHGAMSSHHPACSHGKQGDGNTCECHVGKCQQAIAKAEKV